MTGINFVRTRIYFVNYPEFKMQKLWKNPILQQKIPM